MAPATSFCAWRNIGQQGTAILKRGWKFPVRNLEFFCNPPEWYTCILSTRRRLWGGRCRHAREHRLIHLPSQAQLIVPVEARPEPSPEDEGMAPPIEPLVAPLLPDAAGEDHPLAPAVLTDPLD